MSILTECNTFSPFGFGFLQLILDDDGKAVDYVFLDVSAGLQEIAGFHRNNIIGKKASEVFAGIKRRFNWPAYFGSALAANEIYETSRYVEAFDRECNVIVVPSIDRCLTVIVREVRDGVSESTYLDATIEMLLNTLREQCKDTKEHVNRLLTHCRLLGLQFHLTPEEMNELSMLALLHDIGKIGINPVILKKPALLTSKEWVEMKRHSEIGWRIAKGFAELEAVAQHILLHHERWDGNGYPVGLKAESIPLPCRILAVADAYDAMTSDRVYRKGMKKEQAVEELEKNVGLQFDPQVVRCFIDILF